MMENPQKYAQAANNSAHEGLDGKDEEDAGRRDHHGGCQGARTPDKLDAVRGNNVACTQTQHYNR